MEEITMQWLVALGVAVLLACLVVVVLKKGNHAQRAMRSVPKLDLVAEILLNRTMTLQEMASEHVRLSSTRDPKVAQGEALMFLVVAVPQLVEAGFVERIPPQREPDDTSYKLKPVYVPYAEMLREERLSGDPAKVA